MHSRMLDPVKPQNYVKIISSEYIIANVENFNEFCDAKQTY